MSLLRYHRMRQRFELRANRTWLTIGHCSRLGHFIPTKAEACRRCGATR